MAKLPWAEKHRPTSVKDYTFQDEATKRMVLKFIEEQDMPHLILTGTKGTGKTSLAYVLKNEFGVDDMDFM
jgi:replication-associated recombination protein RarA